MKRGINKPTGIALAFLLIFSSFELRGSETSAPSPTSELRDTILSSATKGLIESIGELSKTASKLTETAQKLLEVQQSLYEKGNHEALQNINPTENPNYSEKIGDDEKECCITIISTNEESKHIYPDTTTNEEILHATKSIWELEPEEGYGGHYVWVPDGSTYEPIKIQSSAEGLNLDEKVYWRGDSIPMAIPTNRLGRYDRKLYNWLIYPKGQWHISLSANYGELTTDNSELLSLMKDIDLHGIIYSIKPSVSYFFKSNLCAGIRLAFTKGELGIDSFKVDIDDDMNFNLHDIKYSSESYTAAVFLQQHFGLSRRGRFSVYNEVELAAGTGNKHFIRPFDGELKDTRTKTQSFNINYSPGVSIMMMKNAAFNLSFGIFGFHLQNEQQWENGEESGNRFTSGINFRFNIFNINFGVSIII